MPTIVNETLKQMLQIELFPVMSQIKSEGNQHLEFICCSMFRKITGIKK